MDALRRVLIFGGLAAGCFAQADLAKILSFETEHPGSTPAGWGGGPAGSIFADGKVVHGGKWSARLEGTADNPQGFTVLTKSLPIDFRGMTIELRGWLKTDDVSGMVGLWMRQDTAAGPVAFDNMASQQLKGTTDWAQYSVKLPVKSEARALFFGFLLSGTGKAWGDDLELLVDGKPVWEAPKVDRAKTPLDVDHEFDNGSRVRLNTLSKVQVENLTLLGKVWGFVKYHHPEVTKGKRHWDYDLFRVLPAVTAAGDRAAANAAISKWIAGIGEAPACNPCAKLDDIELHLRPEVDWIEDAVRLGRELSTSLKMIHLNRHAAGSQFYLSLVPGVGNPGFENEAAYAQVTLPDAGYQLLALYRFWNIVKYWFPYRDVIGEDWDGVLEEFVPRLALATTKDAYQLELMALVARVHDTHANLWSSLAVRPPVGECAIPATLRYIEGQAVVAGSHAEETGLRRGDVLTELDGTAVERLVEQWKPYYAASNEPTRLRDIARSMMRGPCGEASVKVTRANESIVVKTQRVKPDATAGRIGMWHDRPGEAFQVLPEGVAYLKLSAAKASDAAEYVKKASETKGWIIDVRNYPSEFMVFALGQMLVDKVTPFVRFTIGDLANPGAFRWGSSLSLSPKAPRYAAKIAILVDEVTLSSAEYTTMAFRVAPGALVIGSTTAAADGNVSPIPLPGGLRSMVSGIGVFYPDKRPTQRVGIVPDVEVKPTIAGVRAGRDEVLEEAMRRILAQ